MAVTQAQIDGAPDALALGKLQATMQRETQATYATAVTLQGETAANVKRQADAADRVAVVAEANLALQQEVADGLLSKEQEVWIKLYELHLKTRLGPSAITSTTADSVMDDIVKDAVRMTGVAFPLVMGEVNKLP